MRSPLPRVNRRGRVTIAVVAAILILISLFDRIVNLWTDWFWYSEVGYTSVYSGMLRTRVLLFVLFGLGMAAIVGGNLYLAYRLRPSQRGRTGEQHALDRYRLLLTPRIGWWISIIAGVVGLFAGLSGQSHWSQWLLFRNGGSFGVTDPQFNVDVGYYVFAYPFWRYLLDAGFTATTLAVLGALGMHYLYGGVRLQGAGDRMSAAARAHLTGLVALFVALKAVAYFMDRRALLLDYNNGTDLWGGGYTAINAVLPAKEILIYISIVVAVAILIFSNVGARNLIWAGAALALLGISAVAIGGIYPSVVQRFTVNPNIRDKEADYIARTIDATRQAYGLTTVEKTAYPATTLNPPASLATDKTVLPTVRLLDPAVVADTYTQFQQIRSFYDFNEKLDVDRYVSADGKTQDYVVGVREINYSKLTGQQTNWQNRHTVFTHGYGFVAAPANKVCEGAPYFVSGFLGDQAETSGTGSTSGSNNCAASSDLIPASQPRVYYGELAQSDDYVIVGKAQGATDSEFDRPAGDSEKHFSYDGEGGVDVSSLGRRLLYALRFREGNFMLSDVFNDNSKLIYVRDPMERVERIAPFLTLDGDPYPAVINGRITWILDGYTTSASYPYAQQVDLREATSDALTGSGTAIQARQNINYIRNSVKATVDAYDGTVTLYSFDDSDPILRAWNQAFGGKLIKPSSAISAELRAHFRYPEDLFKVQRDLLSKFHVSDPKEFNSAQDFWQVPEDPAQHGSGLKQPPYYLLTQFPGEEEPGFQLTAALTPVTRQNLAALVSGRYVDGKPQLEVLELPRDTRIPGPGQAQQNMSNDATIRQNLSLLSSKDSTVVYGNLLSLPFGGGMLYVQPIYLKSTNVANPFPLLKKVLVSYGEKVAYADTLNQAITQLVQKSDTSSGTDGGTDSGTDNGGTTGGNTGGATGTPTTGAVAAAAAKIQTAINALHDAQEAGNFTAYGKALSDLEAAIKEFEAAQAAAGATPTSSPTPTPSS